MEDRIYGIDLHNQDNPNALTDDDFISEAEAQGFVWTLDGFIKSFNAGEISDLLWLRLIKINN